MRRCKLGSAFRAVSSDPVLRTAAECLLLSWRVNVSVLFHVILLRFQRIAADHSSSRLTVSIRFTSGLLSGRRPLGEITVDFVGRYFGFPQAGFGKPRLDLLAKEELEVIDAIARPL